MGAQAPHTSSIQYYNTHRPLTARDRDTQKRERLHVSPPVSHPPYVIMAMDPRLTKLLEFGIANTPDENGVSCYEPSEAYKSMSEEEKQSFVESIIGPDQSDAAVMLKATRDLLDPTSTRETRDAAVDSLLYCVDVIDNAQDACTIGILEKLVDATVTSAHADVRFGAAWVISTICKDCPKAKDAFHEINALGRVMKAMEQDPEQASKYLSVLSAALENHRGIQTRFAHGFGYKVLTDPLSRSSDDSVNEKRMFIVRKLLKDRAVGLWEHIKTDAVVDVVLGLIAVDATTDVSRGSAINAALCLVQTCMEMAPSTANPYRQTQVHGMLRKVSDWAAQGDLEDTALTVKECVATWKHYKKPEED